MTTVFAQGAVEYVGATGAASSAISVIGEQFNRLLDTVSSSVSDHPLVWAAGVCVAGWLLFRSK
jgi:hypothetical protein